MNPLLRTPMRPVYLLSLALLNFTTSLFANSPQPIPAECQQMFNDIDTLFTEAEKQPGTHVQVKQMKSELVKTKEEISKLTPDVQQPLCEKGLKGIEQFRQRY